MLTHEDGGLRCLSGLSAPGSCPASRIALIPWQQNTPMGYQSAAGWGDHIKESRIALWEML